MYKKNDVLLWSTKSLPNWFCYVRLQDMTIALVQRTSGEFKVGVAPSMAHWMTWRPYDVVGAGQGDVPEDMLRAVNLLLKTMDRDYVVANEQDTIRMAQQMANETYEDDDE